MKKLLMTILVVSGCFAFQAQAENMGTAADESDMITISEAMELSNNTPVMLMGTITENQGNGKYLLKDNSGQTIVIIEDGDWIGVVAQPGNMVQIQGTIDRNGNETFQIDASSAMVQQ